MIEQGFNMLVTAGLADSTIKGGYALELPSNTITLNSATSKAWAYRSVLSETIHELEGQSDLTAWTVQIDAYGGTALAAMQVSRAIMAVLRSVGRVTLSDPDSTVVQNIIRLPMLAPGFNDSAQSYVMSTEYKVFYNDPT